MPPLQILPSVLSSDFSKLAEEVRALVDAGADVLHLDVSHIHELARTRRLECVEIKGTGEKMIRRFSRRALARYVRPAHKDVA